MKILFNNKFIQEQDTKISMLSESFMFGYGIFETIRTYETIPFKSKEHTNRLYQSAKKVGIKIAYSKREIELMINKIAQESQLKNQRIKVIAINEGILITSIKLEENPQIIDRGVNCKSVSCIRSFPEIKSISYLNSYLSHKQAIEKKTYDAILIDKSGEVFEGAYSNIFWFEEDTLCTREDEILQGITRETVLKISPFKTKFKTINLNDLKSKKEVFLTQTTKGIVPIIKIDQSIINKGTAGEKTKILITKFQEHIEKYTKTQLKKLSSN